MSATWMKGAVLIAAQTVAPPPPIAAQTVATPPPPIAATPASQPPATVPAVAPVRSAAQLIRQLLAAHNAARAAVGTAPLRWDARLAADAQRWADHLARTNRFDHSVEPRGRESEGENLWSGTVGFYSYRDMVADWVAERRYFQNNPGPGFSTDPRQDAEHYTQVIWRRTTRVGCGLSSNASDDVLVCRYAVPGNSVGERAF